MQIKYIKIMYCCHFTDVKVIVHHTDDPACVVCRQQATTCPYVSNVILFVSNELWRAVNLLRCIMSTDHVCVCSLQLIIESSLIVIVSSSRPSAPRVNWGPKLKRTWCWKDYYTIGTHARPVSHDCTTQV